MTLKSTVKKALPKGFLPFYHLSLARLGAWLYGNPSRGMIMIGVTGTRGKTSTVNFLWAALTAAGFKVGSTGTANIRIGSDERLNPYHMTMPGRFQLQKLLSEMRRGGCEIAIVETPSEGIEQFRHVGISYDMLVFTTLYPEKLAIHGWDPERCTAKMLEIFEGLMGQPRKKLRGKDVAKTIVVNRDSDGFARFWNNRADKKISYGLGAAADVQAVDIEANERYVHFRVNKTTYRLNIPGSFNATNALPAIAIARALGAKDPAIASGLAGLGNIPGRMEKIGGDQGFSVFVDYAHDQPSFEALLKAARGMRHPGKKIIVVVGAEGGGRDKEKRPVMGRLCAELADRTIVTNVDPYEDDPLPIIKDIVDAAQAAGGMPEKTLFTVEDRRHAIRKALSLANEGDIVLITGKGAEQSMEIGGKSIPWDDRTVVREELSGI
jgi:UDP-N-acetylmuramoyl-L-alanyl-D-glutamate--2,6-diaminopimelate ligase